MEKVPMTAAGYASLEAEFKHRTSVERPRIIAAISEARSHGDLSENAEYHAAKEAQSHNEGRIAELEDKISRAEVIDVSKLSGDTIKFGATVSLVDEDTEEAKVYQIVGDVEADVKQGRVSISSPIARALIGKRVGDQVEVVAPGGAPLLRDRRGQVHRRQRLTTAPPSERPGGNRAHPAPPGLPTGAPRGPADRAAPLPTPPWLGQRPG
jgi:transcription elongation factor GreA